MTPDIYASLVYRPTLVSCRTALIDTYFVPNTCVFWPDFTDFYVFICLFIYFTSLYALIMWVRDAMTWRQNDLS